MRKKKDINPNKDYLRAKNVQRIQSALKVKMTHPQMNQIHLARSPARYREKRTIERFRKKKRGIWRTEIKGAQETTEGEGMMNLWMTRILPEKPKRSKKGKIDQVKNVPKTRTLTDLPIK